MKNLSHRQTVLNCTNSSLKIFKKRRLLLFLSECRNLVTHSASWLDEILPTCRSAAVRRKNIGLYKEGSTLTSKPPKSATDIVKRINIIKIVIFSSYFLARKVCQSIVKMQAVDETLWKIQCEAEIPHF